VRFSQIFAFKYSPRPLTAAPRLEGRVPDEIASERLQRLFAVQAVVQRELNETLVGCDLDVLTTGWGKQPGVQTGRTSCHRVVNFRSGSTPATLGSLTRVRIDGAFPHSLTGCPIPT
jgi:tRNA-2-methylthio-N6-dimethylallyladenosine synthase